MDLNDALKWLNASVNSRSGHSLREPDIVILKGTWRGLTYEQMANGSDYSTNYLMRDVAPKLWKQLSNVFGRSVGKTNFRVALEAYAAANMKSRSSFEAPSDRANERSSGSGDMLTDLLTGYQGYSSGAEFALERDDFQRSGIDWHPAVIPDSASDRLSSAQGTSSRSPNSPLGLQGLSEDNRATRPVSADSRSAAHSVISAGSRSASNTIYSGISIHAMSSATMYGYDHQFDQACRWIAEAITSAERRVSSSDGGAGLFHPRENQPMGQLVGIWGLHGVGKTLIAEKLVVSMGDRFDAVVWRSLTTAPSLDELSVSILSGLGMTVTAGRAMAQLLAVMEQRPLLIVLEGIEAILRPGALAGDYQAAYQNYADFFRAAIGSCSCVLVTGLEGPADFVRQGGYGRRQNVRSLTLSRLSEAAATELLEAEFGQSVPPQLPLDRLRSEYLAEAGGEAHPRSSADADSESAGNLASEPASNGWRSHWPELIARYQGHPLALKAAVRVIKDIFNGRVDEFLQQSSVLFTDILRLLDPSFKRLSRVEVNVLYWLAGQEAPLSLSELQESLPMSMNASEPIPDPVSVLDSLMQRSLLEINTESDSATFYLPALVKAYAVHQFIGRFNAATGPGSQGAIAPALAPVSSTASGGVEGIIDLSPPSSSSVHLSGWFQGRFEPNWHSLDRLFQNSGRPAVGRAIRWTYHLQHETFVKRYKSVDLSAKAESFGHPSSRQDSRNRLILVVAVCQDDQDVYRICAQAQPDKNASVLPEHMELRLLDKQQQVLATVAARHDDSFIQLPYFRGAMNEPFSIEMVLGSCHHTETFVV